MDARQLTRIIDEIHDTYEGIILTIVRGGIVVPTTWQSIHVDSFVPWEVILLSHGDALRGMLDHIQQLENE